MRALLLGPSLTGTHEWWVPSVRPGNPSAGAGQRVVTVLLLSGRWLTSGPENGRPRGTEVSLTWINQLGARQVSGPRSEVLWCLHRGCRLVAMGEDVADCSLELDDGAIAWTECGAVYGVPLSRFPGAPGSRWVIRADRALMGGAFAAGHHERTAGLRSLPFRWGPQSGRDRFCPNGCRWKDHLLSSRSSLLKLPGQSR